MRLIVRMSVRVRMKMGVNVTWDSVTKPRLLVGGPELTLAGREAWACAMAGWLAAPGPAPDILHSETTGGRRSDSGHSRSYCGNHSVPLGTRLGLRAHFTKESSITNA